MRNSKFGLRVFGLALVAGLGLMAFTAAAAQAENLRDGGKAASFLVEKLTALAKAGVTFEFNQEGTKTLLVPTRVDILCTGGVIKGEFKTTVPDGKEALIRAELTGCTAWAPVAAFPHVTKLPCTIPGEKIVIEKAIALPKLHENAAGEKEEYILVEEDGSVFAIVKFEGAECTLPRENKITGSFVGRLNNQIVGKIGSDLVEPLLEFSRAIQELFQVGTEGDHLNFGVNEAYIDASYKGRLTDAAHVGKTLGIC